MSFNLLGAYCMPDTALSYLISRSLSVYMNMISSAMLVSLVSCGIRAVCFTPKLLRKHREVYLLAPSFST